VDVDVDVDVDGLQTSGYRLRVLAPSNAWCTTSKARLEPRPPISVVSPELRLGGRASWRAIQLL